MITGVFILLLTMLGNTFLYTYFKRIMIYQNVSKDIEQLKYKSAQLDSFVNEIERIAQTIVVDKTIQQICKQDEEFDYTNANEISGYLQELIGANVSFHSAILRTPNEIYWSQYPNDPYLKGMINQDWYTAMEEQNQFNTFSDVYVYDLGFANPVELISYRTLIYNSSNPTEPIGELNLNIHANVIPTYIDDYNEHYSSYIWNSNHMIFSSDNTMLEMGEELKSQMLRHRTGSEYRNKDYVIWNRMSNGWTLISLLPSKQLTSGIDNLAVFFILFTPVTILLAMLMLYILITNFTEPIRRLTAAMDDFALGNKKSKVSIHTGDELEMMGNRFNLMVDHINSNVEQMIEDEKIKKKIKFDLLMSKIHPHFIYNTLNSAIYLSRKNRNDDVVVVLRSLISILHDSMSVHSDKIIDTVENEIKIVQAYEAIQRYKYKDKFKISYQMEEATKELLIPKNILQPIVENSIFHGISQKEGDGEIILSIRLVTSERIRNEYIRNEYIRNENIKNENIRNERDSCGQGTKENQISMRNTTQIEIKISDDGVGMPKEVLKKVNQGDKKEQSSSVHSIGICSIYERLVLIYKGEIKFLVESEEGAGTTTVIRLPATLSKEQKISLEVQGDD